MPEPKPRDEKTQADLDYLSGILAKGVSGLIAFGLTDGLKLRETLARVTKNKQNNALWVELFSKFCVMNPQAAQIIELAAAASPTLKDIIDRFNLRPKDVPPEDVKVAEPC